MKNLLLFLLFFSSSILAFSQAQPKFYYVWINGNKESEGSTVNIEMSSLTSFRIKTEFTNTGDDAPIEHGHISYSFPSFTSSTDKGLVSKVSDGTTLNGTYIEAYGSEANAGDGYANYVIVEAYNETVWKGGSYTWNSDENTFEVNVYPKTYGTFKVLFRAAMATEDNWSDVRRDPTSGTRDCLGVYSYDITINITKPNNPPNLPYNEDPDDNKTNVSVYLSELNWSCSDPDGDDVDYEVYFEKGDATPNDKIGSPSGSDQSLSSILPLDYDSKYYWQIIAIDDYGDETEGEIWEFTTESKPNTTPTISRKSPTSSSVTVAANTSTKFTASSYDEDGAGDLDKILWYVGSTKEDETDWSNNLLNPRDNDFSHSFDSPGSYTVKAIVYDQAGATAEVSWTVTVTNTTPTISRKSPTSSSVTVAANTSTKFTASSYDEDGAGDLDKILWYVGSTKEDETDWSNNLLNPRDNDFSHSFDSPGSYTVKAIVYDQAGATAEVSWTVTVTNTTPTISRKSPTSSSVTVAANTSTKFTASSYDEDGAGDLDKILWYVGSTKEDETMKTDWSNNLLNPRDNDFSHSFDSPGSYTVKAIVYDQAGATAEVSWTVTVTNTTPTISRKSPTSSSVTVAANTSTKFTASSYDEDGAGDLDKILWYVGSTKEDETDWSNNLLNPRDNDFSHSFDSPGSYTVKAIVYDQAGATAEVSWTVTVTNTTPTISRKSPTSSSVTVAANTSTKFTASSYDEDGAGDLDKILWYVGSTKEDETDWSNNLLNPRDNDFSHSFDSPGSYTVKAIVYDQAGATAEVSWTVTVTNTTPTISRKSPTSSSVTVAANTSTKFTASSYDEDGAGDLDKILWYVGSTKEDETDWSNNLLNPRDNDFSHSFDSPGSYTVKAIVYDQAGATAEVSWTVTVTNTTPTISRKSPTSSSVTVAANTSTKFTASSYDEDGAGDLDKILWYVGSTKEDETDWSNNLLNPRDNDFSHSFDSPGSYTVKAIVYDQAGATAEVSWTVTVTNTTPTISRKSPTSSSVTVAANTSTKFTASSYDEDGAGDLDKILWYVGSTKEDETDWSNNLLNPRDNDFSHSFDSPGSYTVKAIVYDQAGATAEVSWTVTVTNTTPTISRKSPTSSSVTVAANTSTKFTASSYDEDGAGDLDKILWFVDNVEKDKTNWLANLYNPRENDFSYTFESPGNYTVKAIVYDQAGATAETNWEVTVTEEITNVVPVITRISPETPVSVMANEKIKFTASNYDEDGAGDLDKILWFVDNVEKDKTNWLANLYNPRENDFSYTFESPGNYTVKAIVYDQAGATAETNWEVTVTEEITNVVPVITRISPETPVSVMANEKIKFTASNYDEDGAGDLDKILWFVDNVEKDKTNWLANLYNPRENDFSYTFESPGNYTVKAIVYDQAGATAETNWEVIVNGTEGNPTIERKNPSSPHETHITESTKFVVTVEEPDGASDFDRIEWYVDGNIQSTHLYDSESWSNSHEDEFYYTFNSLNINSVTAKVIDKSGLEAQTSWEVNVKDMLDEPTLISPEDGYAVYVGSELNLSWQSVNGASSYEVEFDSGTDWSAIVGQSSTSLKISTSIESVGTHTWRVRSIHENETSEWSETRSYSVLDVEKDYYTITGICISSQNSYDRIKGAVIQIDNGSALSTNSFEDGSYSILNIEEGTHAISVSHPDYKWQSQSREIDLGEDKNIDFTGTCIAKPEILYSGPQTYIQGEPFDITITIKNSGSPVSNVPVNLDISFPGVEQTQGFIEVLDYEGFFSHICNKGYKPIYKATDDGYAEMEAEYVLCNFEKETGSFNTESYSVTLRITPSSQGDIKLHIKGNIGDQHWPENSDVSGQQNLPEKEIIISESNEVLVNQTIELSTGWNWISFNVHANQMNLMNVLNNRKVNNDEIKTQTQVATYLNEEWYGISEGIKVGEMYMLKCQSESPETIEISGTPAEVENISLVPGWNWIGYYSQVPLEINAALNGNQFNNGDFIRTQNNQESAEYFNGKWYPEQFIMHPGEGYKFLVSAPVVLQYNETAVKSLMKISDSGPQNWKNPSGNQYQMSIHVQVKIDDFIIDSPNSLVGAFKNGECLGYCNMFDGPSGNQFLLGIGTNDLSLDSIELRLYHPELNEEFILADTIRFENNAILGTLTAPIIYNVETETAVNEIESVNYFKLLPNPFTDNLKIEFDLNKPSSIKIMVFDISGRLHGEIDLNQLNSGHYSFNLDDLNFDIQQYKPGIYFVNLIIDDKVNVEKIVKTQ
ncbi:T9SS type A sorting domain-containing protein [uncultured Draconibacterium sp.]|uniref:T9SS type A sorting domain-containing protein n=1 Tax=uncultured Draconibacterium sp. TaxID=1573823 RepID=UPI002AA7F561|nr:T9SS type A sorting domain-containing protein [uncultured Draconibacterium sp.]